MHPERVLEHIASRWILSCFSKLLCLSIAMSLTKFCTRGGRISEKIPTDCTSKVTPWLLLTPMSNKSNGCSMSTSSVPCACLLDSTQALSTRKDSWLILALLAASSLSPMDVGKSFQSFSLSPVPSPPFPRIYNPHSFYGYTGRHSAIKRHNGFQTVEVTKESPEYIASQWILSYFSKV
jgi:hypothetical protein